MAKKIDLTKLEEGLKALNGHDYEAAEKQERLTGNIASDLTFSRGFYARIAGMALGITAQEIKDLPVKEYLTTTQRVYNFLFIGSDSEIASQSSENAQSN